MLLHILLIAQNLDNVTLIDRQCRVASHSCCSSAWFCLTVIKNESMEFRFPLAFLPGFLHHKACQISSLQSPLFALPLPYILSFCVCLVLWLPVRFILSYHNEGCRDVEMLRLEGVSITQLKRPIHSLDWISFCLYNSPPDLYTLTY